MERITRTITSSTVYPAIVHYRQDGQVEFEDLPNFTVNGKINMERALVLTRKQIKTRTAPIVIKTIYYDGVTYSMSLEDFMKYAERMD